MQNFIENRLRYVSEGFKKSFSTCDQICHFFLLMQLRNPHLVKQPDMYMSPRTSSDPRVKLQGHRFSRKREFCVWHCHFKASLSFYLVPKGCPIELLIRFSTVSVISANSFRQLQVQKRSKPALHVHVFIATILRFDSMKSYRQQYFVAECGLGG